MFMYFHCMYCTCMFYLKNLEKKKKNRIKKDQMIGIGCITVNLISVINTRFHFPVTCGFLFKNKGTSCSRRKIPHGCLPSLLLLDEKKEIRYDFVIYLLFFLTYICILVYIVSYFLILNMFYFNNDFI